MPDRSEPLVTRLPVVDEVCVVPLPKGRYAREALVLHDEAGELRAYENVCQHVPIPLDAGGRRFLDAQGHLVCATHGAIYRRSDGECVSGPCLGRRLVALRLRVIDEDHVEIVLDDDRR